MGKPPTSAPWTMLLAAGTFALTHLACGGGPTAPSPQRTVVAHGDFGSPPLSTSDAAHATVVQRFTTAGPGTLDVSVTWAFVGNQMSTAIFSGSCAVDQFGLTGCFSLGETAGAVKPQKLTIENVPAGTYVLAILNLGPSLESGSYEVGLTRP